MCQLLRQADKITVPGANHLHYLATVADILLTFLPDGFYRSHEND